MAPDDTKPHNASSTLSAGVQAFERVEHAVAEAVAEALVATERSLARRFGSGCVRWLRRLLKWGLIALLIAYFALGTLALGLRYWVMPRADAYRPWIERTASEALRTQVHIGQIDASWRGFNPHMRLMNVRLLDAAGSTALVLPQLEATLSWTSVLHFEPRFRLLSVLAPELEVQQLPDARFRVAGFDIDPNAREDVPHLLDWVLAQRHIVVRDAKLRYFDKSHTNASAAAPLDLHDVELDYRHGLLRQRLSLRARPPAELAAPLDLRAEFSRPPFARTSDFTRWKGRVYVALDFIDVARVTQVARLTQLLPRGVSLSRAQGALRVWTEFDRMRLLQSTADVALTGVETRLGNDLVPLRLAAVQGRLAQRAWGEAVAEKGRTEDGIAEDGSAARGAGGTEYTLTQLSLQSSPDAELTLSLPPTDLRYRIDYGGAAAAPLQERHEVEANVLSLDTLTALAQHVPLAKTLRARIAQHAARGTLSSLRASWEGAGEGAADAAGAQTLQTPQRYALRARFTELASAAQSATDEKRIGLPGFDGLSGTIDLTQAGGTLSLNTRDASLTLPGILENERVNVQQLNGIFRWSMQPVLELTVEALAISNADIDVALNGSAQIAQTGNASAGGSASAPQVDFTGRINRVELARLHRYLPLQMGPITRAWFEGAFLGGEAYDGNVVLRGNLNEFPFGGAAAYRGATRSAPGSATRSTTQGAIKQQRGDFSLTARTRNGQLDFAPVNVPSADGKARSSWPHITAIEADVYLSRGSLRVTGRRGLIYGAVLSNVDVRIPDLFSPDAHLLINGVASGPLADMLRFTNTSPVGGWIGNALTQARATGPAQLDLKLDIPLAQAHASNSQRTKVEGAVSFQGNELSLRSDVPPLSRINGRLLFTENGVNANQISAGFAGGQTTIDAATRSDKALVFSANGTATPQGVKQAIDIGAVQRVLDRAQGNTRYRATLVIAGKRPELRIDSDLIGWAIDAPLPLRKAAVDPLPTQLDISPTGSDSDTVRVRLGQTLAVLLERKAARSAEPLLITRGAIRVGGAEPNNVLNNTPNNELDGLPDSGIRATVLLPRLDVDAWSKLLDDSSTAASAKLADAASTNPGSVVNRVALRAREVVIGGKTIENVVLGATRMQEGKDTLWQGNVVSDHAVGELIWRVPNAANPGRISARLTRLSIPDTRRQQFTELLDATLIGAPPTDVPAFDVIADEFELGARKLGRLELVAQNTAPNTALNTAQSAAPVWELQKLSISNSDGQLSATGRWQRDAHASEKEAGARRMTLDFGLDFTDAGKLLARLGVPGAIRAGSGRMEGQIAWHGSPIALDFKSLSGAIKLNSNKGQFLKVDAGAGRLLGVLSLQSIPRRLTLDFRDLFSEGFAFDSVTATARIDNGLLNTRDFRMRGVNATVLMEGGVDLRNETQNLHVLVLPEMSATSASLVYALLANPAIGLGTFLAQLLLRDPLSKAFSYEYDVTGNWNDPRVKKRERAQAAAQHSDPATP